MTSWATVWDARNGLRTDLMEKFATMKPAFIREPGGNYLEGNVMANRFDWQKTVGPVWTRPGHLNDGWGYWSNDGMGLLEYLTWAESIGAKPMLGVFAGYTLNGYHVPLDQLGPYVKDALDEIEYAVLERHGGISVIPRRPSASENPGSEQHPRK